MKLILKFWQERGIDLHQDFTHSGLISLSSNCLQDLLAECCVEEISATNYVHLFSAVWWLKSLRPGMGLKGRTLLLVDFGTALSSSEQWSGLPQPAARGLAGSVWVGDSLPSPGLCEQAGVQMSVSIVACCYSHVRALDLRTYNHWSTVRWLSARKAASALLNYMGQGTSLDTSMQMSIFLFVSLFLTSFGLDQVLQTRRGLGYSRGCRLFSASSKSKPFLLWERGEVSYMDRCACDACTSHVPNLDSFFRFWYLEKYKW